MHLNEVATYTILLSSGPERVNASACDRVRGGNMNRGISFALLAAGAVLVIWGVSASESLVSDVSKLMSGLFTERATWLWVGGVLAIAVGLSGIFLGRSRD